MTRELWYELSGIVGMSIISGIALWRRKPRYRPIIHHMSTVAEVGPKVVLATTCRGRLNHIRKTLPENLKYADGAIIVLLDYNDQNGLSDYVREYHQADIDAGRLVYYRNDAAPRFRMAHAKNQGHRCAMLEGADIIVTLDADNFIGAGFVRWIRMKYQSPTLSYLCPDFDGLPPHNERYDPQRPYNLRRGFYGRMAIRTQDFVKIGGYNEIYEMWGAEDVDILARLRRLGLERGIIPSKFLDAIPHGSDVRFKEWPEARQFENDKIHQKCEKAHDTVVNYGQIGVGRVTRNFGDVVEITPLPTRVFGIGLQRTGTTSLQEALESLGYDVGHWKSGAWAKSIWQEMHRWGRSRIMEKFNALCDNPIPALYKELDEAYPGSKFILTIRDEDAWIESMRRLWSYDSNSDRWMWDEDGFSHQMHGIIYGTAEFDEETFRVVYRHHVIDVLEYFQGRGDLLIIDIDRTSTTDRLAEFLGRPKTGQSFPHRNRG